MIVTNNEGKRTSCHMTRTFLVFVVIISQLSHFLLQEVLLLNFWNFISFYPSLVVLDRYHILFRDFILMI